MRDYTTYVLQEAQPLIQNLYTQEQAIEEAKKLRDRQKQRNAENAAERARKDLLRAGQPPTSLYQFFTATEEADATAFRTAWQENQKDDCLREEVKSYYKENFEAPNIDLSILPPFSFVLQFTFSLAQPYISRDEQDFYIIDNPVRKDKIFGLPYVASTSWKGSLRAALWQLGHKAESEPVRHLFGNEKSTDDPERFRSGCLYFFPTFFTTKSLEIINPHDRKQRVGKNPILFESVPIGATGLFTLLYVPFDLVGKDEEVTRAQVAGDLQLLISGLRAMFRDYGFGAKTRSGFGLAKEAIPGSLILRMIGNEQQKEEEMVIISSPAPSLPRYLEAPDRLKQEYLNKEGTFRERSEAELKKMNKGDRQLYDKAKTWWAREGKRLAEATKQPRLVETTLPVPSPQMQQISWPKWSFASFEQLLECAKEAANKLSIEAQDEQ